VGAFDPCPWGLGPELKGDKHPHWMGSQLSASTFGHFGGSGTFLWVDPTLDAACVVLAELEFDNWAMTHWPPFNNALVDELTAVAAQ
jgi:CubicO group peptidase (beta-lactamase class C family)